MYKHTSGGYPPVRATFEWLFIVFAAIQSTGIFIDGWAHAHILEQLDSFFTPWHAIFYGGFLIATGLLIVELLKNHAHGYAWTRALPREYFFALGGAAIFMAGGFGDLIWHTLFGIEVGVDALLSPTHMMLAIGGGIMASGPLHAIWYRYANAHTLLRWPTIISFMLFFTTFTFMVQFFHPFWLPLWMSNLSGAVMTELEQTFYRELGVANTIVYTGIFMGLLLATIRSWKFPFGSFTFILGMNAFAVTLMRGELYWTIASGFIAGFFVDIIYACLFERLRDAHTVRLFGFLVPVVMMGVYMAMALAFAGTWWSMHFVAGYVVIAGIVGALLTYLVAPPGDVVFKR